jgi:hypothetical protein
MPTYLPGGQSDKVYAEKLTLRGQGVEGLVEVIDSFVPENADPNQLATPYAKEVFGFLTSEDFPEVRTPMYEYLPEQHETRSYAERLTLRGHEVEALREIISKVDRKDLSFNAATLIDFVMYKMGSEPIHVDQKPRQLTA